MILASTLFVRAVLLPHLIEFPTNSGDHIAIEALIKLPKLDSAQRYRLQQAAENAVKMTPQYGKRDISRILAPGFRFRIDQLSDALRLGLTVEPKDMGAGMSVLCSVLTEPTFLPDAIKVSSSAAPSVWERIGRSFDTVPVEVDQASLKEIWGFVIRPDAITIGVRGAFPPGKASELWRQRDRFWQEYKSQKLLPGRVPKPNLEIKTPPVLVLSSPVPVLTPDDLLAATVLGSGKDSILWKLCRESLRMSYLQESFLVPTETGWEFRIAIASDERILVEDSIPKLKTQLLESVAKLTEKDLSHARGLLDGFFDYGQPGIPLKLGETAVTAGDDNESLFRDLYLDFKRSNPMTANTWKSKSGLETIKDKLKSVIESSSASLK